MSADTGPEFVRLEEVVGRDRHEPAVADLHLAMELQQSFVLPPLFGTEPPAGKDQHERILLLQVRKTAVHAAVVRQRVVGKHGARNDVGSHIVLPAHRRAKCVKTKSRAFTRVWHA